MLMTAFNTGNV